MHFEAWCKWQNHFFAFSFSLPLVGLRVAIQFRHQGEQGGAGAVHEL